MSLGPLEWRQRAGQGEGAHKLADDLFLEDAGVHPVACPGEVLFHIGTSRAGLGKTRAPQYLELSIR